MCVYIYIHTYIHTYIYIYIYIYIYDIRTYNIFLNIICAYTQSQKNIRSSRTQICGSGYVYMLEHVYVCVCVRVRVCGD